MKVSDRLDRDDRVKPEALDVEAILKSANGSRFAIFRLLGMQGIDLSRIKANASEISP